ncbi:hypothetical protein ABMA27_016715 [Loxostege sticticalis]|uniref:DDE Tnp4 domain-containing protein n=1 Tax=Loxostege sticticalis TaxID=481309 RepID=A0ABR3I3B7_LOXSC
MSYDSDEEVLLLILALRHKKKKKWVHEINKKRLQYGEYHTLFGHLESDEDRFFQYFRMSRSSFEDLHEIIRLEILKQDTNYRLAITTRERLAICLRYLATGNSFHTISFSFRVGRSTVAGIVEEVTRAIWNKLQPIYMPAPTLEKWKESAAGYEEIWGFPNCVGSIDGKHVRIKCPANSGSNYFNYKSYHSIVLLAVVDPFYNFLVVDIGAYGRHSDSGIFENSSFYSEYIAGKEILPPKPLPGANDPVPHVIIGDEGFGLQNFLMRPFPKHITAIDESKRRYNYRLCRARRTVENAFGILSEKWRIFHRPIDCKIETAIDIVKAAACLHNFVRHKDGHDFASEIREQQQLARTQETATRTNSTDPALVSLAPTNRRSSSMAFEIREKFVQYFNENV